MLVDEYHDTSWTRGQYPAAPPYRLDQKSALSLALFMLKSRIYL